METDSSRDDLLESLVEEFKLALRQGTCPSIEDYQRRYPDLAEDLEELLSSVVMIEQLKSASESSSNSRRLLDEVSKLERIGPYQIQREIGRGGMGVVFAAIHTTLGRQVAIKVLPTPLVNSELSVERFLREAQAAAKLHHTNIVGVYSAGEGPGYHYYVMDFVGGQSLNLVIDQLKTRQAIANVTSGKSRLSVADTIGSTPHESHFHWAATIAAQITNALSHAHSLGILHRDIKPANMILDQAGRIWLTDFGLAKDSAQQQALTKTGDVIGTPQYLPPESLESKYDVRSETYCVGLVLYEMIAIQPAYKGATPAELIRAIASRSPLPLLKVEPRTPVDLATIVDKATSREPSHRYQSAADLERDLNAFLEDRPISARRPKFWETGYRWAKRNPLPASLSVASALLLLLVAVSASVGYIMTTAALSNEAQVSKSLRNQQQQTESAKLEAEQNYLAMKSQYDRAENNVSMSIEAFDALFQFLVSRGSKGSVDQDIEGLKKLSGIETSLTTEDAKFLDDMVKFYERFAANNAENETLKAESAKAYRRVGNIYQIVGQLQPAIEAYERSLSLLPAIQSGTGESQKQDLIMRSRIQNELSAAHRLSGHFLQAQEWNQKSIQLLEDSPLSRKDRDVRLELARTKSAMGFDVLRTLSTPARPPSNRPIVGDRPGTFEIGRRMWERVNKPLIFEAIGILDQLLVEDPENGEYSAVRASCYWSLAAADLPRDQANGFEYRNKAISSLDALVKRHPDQAEYQYLLALACSLTLLNSNEATSEQNDEHQLVERGVSLTENLIEQYPNTLDYHQLHAKLKVKLAAYCIQQKQRDMAFEHLRSARVSIQLLAKRAVSDRSFMITLSALARELLQLEGLYREAGNLRTANEISQMLKQINQARKQ